MELNTRVEDALRKFTEIKKRYKEVKTTFDYLYKMDETQRKRYKVDVECPISFNSFTVEWTAMYETVLREKHALEDVITQCNTMLEGFATLLIGEEDDESSQGS